VVGAVTTASLSLVGEGAWPAALLLFSIASVGYYSANVFYDSLIIDVSKPQHYSLVSSLGFSLGYFGGASLLGLFVWMLKSPPAFGFDDSVGVVKFAFVSVGAWWLIFLVPLMLVVRENKAPAAAAGSTIRAAYLALAETFRQIRQYRNVFVFLVAYWLYIGGLFAVIFMAVNFGQRLGFSETDLVLALLITNFVGFPATLAYGYLGHHIGPKRAIYVGLAVYIGVAVYASRLEDVSQFYAMAITIGLVQGGVQGMSRSLYASLIPADQAGEFFGFLSSITPQENFESQKQNNYNKFWEVEERRAARTLANFFPQEELAEFELVDEVIRFARAKGYKTLTLWTNDVLVSARRIYQAAGFTLEKEERHHAFGKDLAGQYWNLTL